MRWLQFFSDQWLLGSLTRRIYRRTYSRYQAKAKTEAEEILAAARLQARQRVRLSQEEAIALQSRARQEFAAIQAQARKAGLDSVKPQAEREYAAARTKGIAEGREEGRLLAYIDAAEQLGLTDTHRRSPSQVAAATCDEQLDLDMAVTRPNIYDTGAAWIVRVVAGGNRHVRAFPYVRNDKSRKLVEAARFRETLAPESQSQHEALYLECLARVQQDYGTQPGHMSYVQAAELFHQRVQQHAPAGLHRIGFLGEDPQDRFPGADTAVLLRTWYDVVGVRGCVLTSFRTIGLDGHRTVRDLLLCTAEELTSVNGFKAASLQKLRRGLARHGLALWGEPVPVSPTMNRADAQREFRAINLDDVGDA